MKRKRRSSWLALVVVLGLILAIDSFAWRALDRLFIPWAFARPGRPALVGEWVGTLTTATGRPRVVYLDMVLPDPPERRHGGRSRNWRGDPYGELAGTLQACDERGEVRRYAIEGEPDDRGATRLHFYATPEGSRPPDGLTFSWFKGSWDRADRLALTAQLYWRRGESAISGDSHPDTRDTPLALGRADEAEFRARCARVAQRGR